MGTEVRHERASTDADLEEVLILDAAQQVFETVGLRRSSLDAIAQSAGVSRSTVYRRFRDKETLVLAVLNRVLESNLQELDAATVGQTPQDAVVAAFAMCARLDHEGSLIHRVMTEDLAVVRNLNSIQSWTVEGSSRRVAGALRRAGATMPEADLLDVSELLVRVAHSFVDRPSRTLSAHDPEAVARFARKYLAPMVF
ncbi:hypothetical protein BOO86_21520 [Mycobacterium sp. CBMA 234]|nr:hypothetical protein [Mycolicibacterium sp. CBMA 234]